MGLRIDLKEQNKWTLKPFELDTLKRWRFRVEIFVSTIHNLRLHSPNRTSYKHFHKLVKFTLETFSIGIWLWNKR